MVVLLIIISILSFLILLSILVFLHELGHYFVAKKSGVKVYEFSIGMGPAIFQRVDNFGTTWSIRIFPVGGYVVVASEALLEYWKIEKKDWEITSDDKKDKVKLSFEKYGVTKETLNSIETKNTIDGKKTITKMLFALGGIIANLAIVWIALFFSYTHFGKKYDTNQAYLLINNLVINNITISNTVVYIEYIEDVTNVNSSIIYQGFQSIDSNLFVRNGQLNQARTIDVHFKNFGKEQVVTMKEKEVGKYYYSDKNSFSLSDDNVMDYVNFKAIYGFEAFGQSFIDTWILIGKTFVWMWWLIDPATNSNSVEQITISSNTSTIIHMRAYYYQMWYLLAIFSAFLLAFNILPIPPLDGYRFGVYFIEGITRKKMNPKVAMFVESLGWIIIAFLTIWMIVVPF